MELNHPSHRDAVHAPHEANLQPRTCGGGIRYYAMMVAGLAALAAAPFIAIHEPSWLLVLAPVVLAWGVGLLNEYWRWVRSLGK